MWVGKLYMVALGFLFYMLPASGTWCTCRSCQRCTGCSATACSRVGRALRLLDYLDIYSREVERQLAVTPPVIPCTVENSLCDFPYNKYCCALQSDGTKTCGLGEQWSTCVSGSTLINNVITPIYTKLQCDFDFACSGKEGKECCGGLDLYNGEGPGTCSTNYCTSTPLVACNYVGSAASQFKTPAFDASVIVNGVMPTQDNNKYCGDNNISNRNNGRCRASNLCCSPLGLCGETAESCATKSISWVWMGSTHQWVQTGGAADSSIPCGNGTIGNGRCPTNDDTYGVTCCSEAGFCGSQYCNGASGNVYKCSCAHGTAGSGTRGCTTCASCNEGYYLSSSNSNTCSPIKLGVFNCPGGAFVTSIKLWYDSGRKSITGLDFFKCSDGSQVNVYKGQSTGIRVSSTQVSGYCGGKVGYVYGPSGTKNQLTTEFTVVSCDGTTTTSFGGPNLNYPQNGAIAYTFQSGHFLTGLKGATCQNGSLNNVCFLIFTFATVQIAPTSVPVPTATPTAAGAGPTSPTTKKPTIVPTVAPTSVPATLSPTPAPTCSGVAGCEKYSSKCVCTKCVAGSNLNSSTKQCIACNTQALPVWDSASNTCQALVCNRSAPCKDTYTNVATTCAGARCSTCFDGYKPACTGTFIDSTISCIPEYSCDKTKFYNSIVNCSGQHACQGMQAEGGTITCESENACYAAGLYGSIVSCSGSYACFLINFSNNAKVYCESDGCTYCTWDTGACCYGPGCPPTSEAPLCVNP